MSNGTLHSLDLLYRTRCVPLSLVRTANMAINSKHLPPNNHRTFLLQPTFHLNLSPPGHTVLIKDPTSLYLGYSAKHLRAFNAWERRSILCVRPRVASFISLILRVQPLPASFSRRQS